MNFVWHDFILWVEVTNFVVFHSELGPEALPHRNCVTCIAKPAFCFFMIWFFQCKWGISFCFFEGKKEHFTRINLCSTVSSNWIIEKTDDEDDVKLTRLQNEHRTSVALQEHNPGGRERGTLRRSSGTWASGERWRSQRCSSTFWSSYVGEKCDLSSMNGQALFLCSGAEEQQGKLQKLSLHDLPWR